MYQAFVLSELGETAIDSLSQILGVKVWHPLVTIIMWIWKFFAFEILL